MPAGLIVAGALSGAAALAQGVRAMLEAGRFLVPTC